MLFLCLVFVSLFLLQGRAHVLQYVFFARYPLLFGVLLALGPALAVSLSAEMFANLFVLDPVGLGIASALGWFLASTVIYTGNLIFGVGVLRTGLPFFRPAAPAPEAQQAGLLRQQRISEWVGRWHPALSAGLCLPFALQLVRWSTGRWYLALGAAALGIAAGVGTHAVATRMIRWRGQDAVALVRAALALLARPFARPFRVLLRPVPPGVRTRLAQTMATIKRSALAGYQVLGGEGGSHGRAAVFLLTSVALYLAGYFLLRASFGDRRVGWLAQVVPPLAYLQLLALVFGWLLPALSFFFDKYRVPVFVPAGLAWLLLSLVSRSDHLFDHHPVAADGDRESRCALTPTVAARRWADQVVGRGSSERRPTMVVVAASGGGISASLWSARVLTGLAADPRFGEPFARSINLVSSASGGGLGALYFVHAYRSQSPLFAPGILERIVEAAGASSLHETGFSLAYDDFLRLLVPAPIAAGLRDRGEALERSWARRLQPEGEGGARPTLASWRPGVADGWRPTQVFNATIAETGERLLLAPVAFPIGPCAGAATAPWRARSLDELYGPSELNLTTAARLSATFPWVTPQSRADTVGPGISGYHLADAGYYDNFGVVTAIEWLSQVHAEVHLGSLAEKVLVVQIRASRHMRREPASEGWLYSTLGPLLTVLNVRTTSQRNQNDAALGALRALLWQGGVPLETVELELDIDTPTSWHLSASERRLILEQWDRNPQIQGQRQRLLCLWQNPGAAWPQACGVRPPPSLAEPSAAARLLEQTRPESRPSPEPARMVPLPALPEN